MVNFLDTNIFIRFITGDDEPKTVACGTLFRRLVEGAESAMTTEVIIAEVTYVLSSARQYALSAPDVAARLQPLVSITNLRVPGKVRVLRALDLYATNTFLDFEDALIVAYIEGSDSDRVVSYDRHFDRIPGIQRIEP